MNLKKISKPHVYTYRCNHNPSSKKKIKTNYMYMYHSTQILLISILLNSFIYYSKNPTGINGIRCTSQINKFNYKCTVYSLNEQR